MAGAVAAGYTPTLDTTAIDDAIARGQSRIESLRTRYHEPYRMRVGRPPVDYMDLVTPFRRIVIAAEARARVGDRFRQSDALALAATYGQDIEFFIELTFHPLNTYVGMPPYTATLARAGSPGRIAAIDTQRVPRFGARVEGLPIPYPATPRLPPGGQPLLGGTLVARFAGRRLEPGGVYEVIVEESGKELARARIDLGALR